MTSALYTALLVALLILSTFLFGLVFTLVRIKRERWKEAAKLSGSLKSVISGAVEPDRNGILDPRVAKGKVWNKATENWEPQGKLSDEYIESIRLDKNHAM